MKLPKYPDDFRESPAARCCAENMNGLIESAIKKGTAHAATADALVTYNPDFKKVYVYRLFYVADYPYPKGGKK